MSEILHTLTYSQTRLTEYEKVLKSIKDPDVKNFVDDIWVLTAKRGLRYLSSKRYASNVYFSKYMKNLKFEDITWKQLCNLVKKKPEMGYYCCFLMYKLLDENIYRGEYEEKLYELKDIFSLPDKGIQERHYASKFCDDDIKYLLKIDASIRRYYIIQTDNPHLWNILAEFCEKDKNTQGKGTKAVTREWFFAHANELFQDDEASITGISSFSYSTFMHEIARCKSAPRA